MDLTNPEIKIKVGTWNLGWVSEGTYCGKNEETKKLIVDGVAQQIELSHVHLCTFIEFGGKEPPTTMMEMIVNKLGTLWTFAFSENFSPDGKAESIGWLYRCDILQLETTSSKSHFSSGGRGFGLGNFLLREYQNTGLLVFGVHFKANHSKSDVIARIEQARDLCAILNDLCIHKNAIILGDFNENLSAIGKAPVVPKTFGSEDSDEDWTSLAEFWSHSRSQSFDDQDCLPMIPALSADENTRLLDSEPNCLDNILIVNDACVQFDPTSPGAVLPPEIGHIIADHRLVVCGIILKRGDRDYLDEQDEDEGTLTHMTSKIQVFSEMAVENRKDAKKHVKKSKEKK